MFEILITKQLINCKYFLEDILCTVGILGHFKEAKDEVAAMSKVPSEIEKVTTWFFKFQEAIVNITFAKYLDKEITVVDIPKQRKVKIPCFTDIKPI